MSSSGPSIKTLQIRAVEKDGEDIIVEIDGRCRRCGCEHQVIAVYLCKKCGALLCENQILERKMTAVGPRRHRTAFLHVIHEIKPFTTAPGDLFPRPLMRIECGPCTMTPTKSGLMFDMETVELWEA